MAKDRKRYEFIITNKVYVKKFDDVIKKDLDDDFWLNSKYVMHYKNIKDLKVNIHIGVDKDGDEDT